ncbi:MAG TPA: hypothetical protein VG965_00245 [Patescibacteria group bacterium]|nr:hypothetical protein [Patescibacteria group bacterium]
MFGHGKDQEPRHYKEPKTVMIQVDGGEDTTDTYRAIAGSMSRKAQLLPTYTAVVPVAYPLGPVENEYYGRDEGERVLDAIQEVSAKELDREIPNGQTILVQGRDESSPFIDVDCLEMPLPEAFAITLKMDPVTKQINPGQSRILRENKGFIIARRPALNE